MKKGMIFATLLFAIVAFVGVGIAGGNKLAGTLVKIDGAMYTVKDEMDKEHKIHVDPKSTKKTGELKTGAMVEAEVDANGHANWIKVAEMAGHEGMDMGD
jgi:hypothetical protein